MMRRTNLGAEILHIIWISTLILLALPTYCRAASSTVSNNNSIYRELPSQSNDAPPGCRRTTKPAYYLENTQDEYKLVVTIPEQVSRKKLKIDVDYNVGHIEVFGWWSEGKLRGEEAQKMCVYAKWGIDSGLLSEEAIVSSDLVSVYDLLMAMHDQQLILTVPMAIEQQIPMAVDEESEGLPNPPLASPIQNSSQDDDDAELTHQASLAVAYGTSLWKKFRGLVRVKDHARNNYYYYSNEFTANASNSTPAWSLWDFDAGLPPSSLAYERYRQDALEEFLAYTLTTMDQDSNQ